MTAIVSALAAPGSRFAASSELAGRLSLAAEALLAFQLFPDAFLLREGTGET